MASLEECVGKYIKEDGEEKQKSLESLVDKIASGEWKLVELVIELGQFLTDDVDDQARCEAIACLSKTLTMLDKDQLSCKENEHLVKFFIMKFQDEILAFKYILTGINALCLMLSFDNIDNINEILIHLCDAYNPKNFNASIRYLAFQILENLKNFSYTKIDENNGLNDLYIKAFLNVANGEKDPRNLLISFNLNKYILQNLHNLQEFKEDLFDVTFCYFPITFKPPKNDPYKISVFDLKTSLTNALTANEVTSDDLLGNLFDKLTSDSLSVKLDVVLTLKAAIINFSSECIFNHWLQIWDALKFEILHNSSLHYEIIIIRLHELLFNNKALPTNLDLLTLEEKEKEQITQIMVTVLSIFTIIAEKMIGENDGYLDNFLSKVGDDLIDSKPKFGKQTYLIASSIAQANTDSFNFIINNFLPSIFESQENSNIDEQIVLIDELSFILYACFNLYGSYDKPLSSEYKENKLSEFFKDEIIMLLTKSLLTSSPKFANLQIKSLQCLRILVELNGFLNTNEVTMIMNYLIDILIEYTENPENEKMIMFKKIYPFCINVLFAICRYNSDLISTIFMPKFLSTLLSNDSLLKTEKTLKVLSDVALYDGILLEYLCVRLTSRLYESKNFANDVLLVNVIYQLLLKFLRKDVNFKTNNTFVKSYIPNLLRFFMHLSKIDNTLEEDSLIELGSRIIYLIILRCDDFYLYQKLLNDVKIIFFSDADLSKELPTLLILDQIKPINVLSKPTKLISIVDKIFAAVDYKKTEFPLSSTDTIDTIIKMEYNNLSSYERLNYLQLIAIIVNKWNIQTSYLSNIIAGLQAKISHNLFNSSWELELLAWIAKGLLLRNDPLSKECIRFQCELLDKVALVDDENGDLGLKVCKSFKILVDENMIFQQDFLDDKLPQKNIVSPNEGSTEITKNLSKLMAFSDRNNNLNYRLLYKQQCYNYIIPDLILKFKSANNNVEIDLKTTLLRKRYYLTAFSLISRYMKADIILVELNRIFPLLLETLKVRDTKVRVAGLTTLSPLIINKTSGYISNYLSTLIPALINNMKSKCYFERDFEKNSNSLTVDLEDIKFNSTEVRILSIECLMKLVRVCGSVKIIPYKDMVVKYLCIALDDKKRTVRKKACDCRQEYIELGQVKA